MSRLASCALAVLVAGCGTAATPARSQTPSSPRFVKPPLVTFDGTWVRIYVRLDRPLKYNVGEPEEYRGRPASLMAAGGRQDIPGLWRDPVRPTCYSQDLYLSDDDPKPVEGQLLEVTFWLSASHQIKATVPVRLGGLGEATRTTQELGCPSKAPGEPRTYRCRGSVYAEGGEYEVGLRSARGTSCRTTRRVMRSVAAITDSRCYRDLCLRHHRHHLGFRCEAALMGEAYWDIVCRRGQVEVRGDAAD